MENVVLRKIGVRALGHRAAEILRLAETTGDPILVLRHARPVAFIIALDSDLGRDIVLIADPDAAVCMTSAERDRIEAQRSQWEQAPAAGISNTHL